MPAARRLPLCVEAPPPAPPPQAPLRRRRFPAAAPKHEGLKIRTNLRAIWHFTHRTSPALWHFTPPRRPPPGSCRSNTLNTQLGAYSDFLSKKAL